MNINRITAALVLALAVTAMQNAVIAAHKHLLHSAWALLDTSNESTSRALAGWDKSVESIEQWREASERFEAVANRCTAEMARLKP